MLSKILRKINRKRYILLRTVLLGNISNLLEKPIVRSGPIFCLHRRREMTEHTDTSKLLFNVTNIYGMSISMYEILKETRK